MKLTKEALATLVAGLEAKGLSGVSTFTTATAVVDAEAKTVTFAGNTLALAGRATKAEVAATSVTFDLITGSVNDATATAAKAVKGQTPNFDSLESGKRNKNA